MDTQHRLLKKLQDILETSCFTFAQSSFREEMKRKGWECAECAELNIWARFLRSKQPGFPTDSIADLGKPYSELLDSLVEVRHTAVHRIRVTVSRVQDYLRDAETFATLIEDRNASSQIAFLRGQTELAVDDLNRNKDLLESKIAKTIRKFAVEIAELEKSRQEAIDKVLNEDQVYQKVAVINLENAMNENISKQRHIETINFGDEDDGRTELESSNENDDTFEDSSIHTRKVEG